LKIVQENISQHGYEVKEHIVKPETHIKAYSAEKIRETHKQAYLPWKPEDDKKLAQLFYEGKDIKELARIFERNEGAISSRIKKLELEKNQ